MIAPPRPRNPRTAVKGTSAAQGDSGTRGEARRGGGGGGAARRGARRFTQGEEEEEPGRRPPSLFASSPTPGLVTAC